jgi:hypothetical protein
MTKVFGYSDDVIQFTGQISDSIDCYDTDLRIIMSDGTVLNTHYGKIIDGVEDGIWLINVEESGSLYDHITLCTNEDETPYSDVVFFKDGDIRIVSVEKV